MRLKIIVKKYFAINGVNIIDITDIAEWIADGWGCSSTDILFHNLWLLYAHLYFMHRVLSSKKRSWLGDINFIVCLKAPVLISFSVHISFIGNPENYISYLFKFFPRKLWKKYSFLEVLRHFAMWIVVCIRNETCLWYRNKIDLTQYAIFVIFII